MADGGLELPPAGDVSAQLKNELLGKTLPHNIEAEQALLGAILINNEVADRVAFLTSEHFFDPVHGRIFELLRRRIGKGILATPTTLKTLLEDDTGLQELGGVDYLGRMAKKAITIFNAKDYAQTIYDLAMRRKLAEVGETITLNALNGANEETPNEQITDAEARLYKLAEAGNAEGGFVSFKKALVEAVETANAAYQRDGGLAGLSTGLTDMDLKMGGLHPSDLLILAGRPSMGKTALVTNLAFNVAKAYQRGIRSDGTEGAINGGVVGFFSLEMSAEQLATRILSEQAQVASEKIRKGDMDEDEFRRFVESAQALENAPLFIDDTPALHISTLTARARRLKRQHGLDLLIVDYLQLCRGSAENRVQEISEITQGMKAIAKELNIPVIALSQLSRQVENRDDKRPQLSDLRESGSIEQDADVVMFVYREEYYVGRMEPTEGTAEHAEWQQKMEQVHNLAEVILGKQRHGPIGSIKLMFDSRYTRFSDLARDHHARGGYDE
ncbi:MAG: replicative DNA helicase [Neomegalonema sp.]|nr:replicative DNA helicase [Neomegalonema sp.]